MRADARRNRDRLLAAAVEVILDVGAEPPLDAIARRAEVGIGTLYRHFPDRDALLHAVARHALDGSIDAATAAMEQATDGHDAVRRYVHAAVDLGVGVLNLIHPALGAPDWSEQRDQISALLDELVARGTADGTLRPATDAADIVFGVIRFARPVDIGLTRADERALAHRHLDIYVDGLGTGAPTGHRLPSPSVLDRWAD